MVVYKRVSADEARATAKQKRPDMVRDDSKGSIQKAAKAPASWDAQARSARFIMTTQDVDRYGDVVVTAGADLTQFMLNPVGLLFHNSRTWPVAHWDNIKTIKGTMPRMEGDFVMLPSGGPVKEIDEAAWMIENGGIRACSIGFIPDWDDVELIWDDEEDWVTGFKFNAWELTECSICAVPANAAALVKSANGDMDLARELVEDVLDNWVRSPEGLLLQRSDFEARYKDVAAERSFIVLGKDLEKPAPQPEKAVEITDEGFVAATDEDAAKFRGIEVKFKADDTDNVDDAHVKEIGGESGTVIDAWVKDLDGETVLVFAVEFLTKNWSGLFRAVRADRLELAKQAEVTEPAPPEEKSGDEKLSVTIEALTDFTDTHKAIDEIEARVDGVLGKIAKLFGFGKTEKTAPAVEAEPPPDPVQETVVPKTAEEIAALRTRGAETLARLREKKLIAAE